MKKIEDFWKPIHSKSVEDGSLCGPAMPEAVSDHGHLPSVDLLHMNGAQLAEAVRQTSGWSACGADGWRRYELLALPGPFWDSLARVMHGMAKFGTWYPTLSTVVTTLIPKHVDVDVLSDPSCLRPISVASLVFRAWGKVLARRLDALLEISLPICAHGFRKGASAQTTMAWVSLKCQNAVLSERPAMSSLKHIQE